MQKVTIDGTEYNFDTLSDEIKNQLISLSFVDNELAKLQSASAVYQTARNAYSKVLSDLLQKDKN